jgi:hypothetical protein
MLLDVVIAGPGLDEDFLQRAIPVDICDTEIQVISPRISSSRRC